jgi:hypothetical protein
LEELKKQLFLQSEKNKTGNTTKVNSNEKDISAIEQKEKKQTRFQRTDGNCQRQKSTESPPCQRPEKTDSFRRTEA